MGLALLFIIAVLLGDALKRRVHIIRAKSKMLTVVSMLIAVFGSSQSLLADQPSQSRGKGLIPPTKEEWNKIESSWHRVVKVRPNKIGGARIKAEMEKNGLAPMEFPIAKSHEDEFVTGSKGFVDKEGDPAAPFLPSYVDNSILPSFPPIGDQGQQGSCVAWASTYYQATHEIGLVNGTNNKTSSAGILSPKWTYNMINGGGDNGSVIQDGYTLLSQNGAVPMNNFPYDGNYLEWDTNPQDWITAMHYRTGKAKYIPGLGGSGPQDLTRIKHALNNGHVVTIGTYVDSWVFTTIQANPSSANRFVGEQAVSWMNGSNGGHCITICGYDDNVWIDVNGNGQVDPGETGAFLFSNSWGPGWGNQGFMWVSYDAFLAMSAVPNGPNNGRVPLADATNSTAIYNIAKAHNYAPSIIAQFALSQTQRNQIKVTGGISPLNQKTPSMYFGSGAIYYQGGAYEFDGTSATSPESATFALDLSDLASLNSPNQRFYLMVNDNMAGYPTTLNSFALVDLAHGTTVPFTNVPLSVDNGKITNYIDYDFTQAAATSANPPGAKLTSPLSGTTINGMVPMIAKVTGSSIRSVDFYVDTTCIATEKSAPFFVYLDTTKLANGRHRLTAVVQDNSNRQATGSAIVNIRN